MTRRRRSYPPQRRAHQCAIAALGKCRGFVEPEPREAGLLPAFPFGSDFTGVEQRLIPALEIMQSAQHAPLHLARLLWRGMTHPPGAADRECLARLGLDRPTTFTERMYRALV